MYLSTFKKIMISILLIDLIDFLFDVEFILWNFKFNYYVAT